MQKVCIYVNKNVCIYVKMFACMYACKKYILCKSMSYSFEVAIFCFRMRRFLSTLDAIKCFMLSSVKFEIKI